MEFYLFKRSVILHDEDKGCYSKLKIDFLLHSSKLRLVTHFMASCRNVVKQTLNFIVTGEIAPKMIISIVIDGPGCQTDLISIAFLQSREWIFISFDFQWTLMSVIYNRDSVISSTSHHTSQ